MVYRKPGKQDVYDLFREWSCDIPDCEIWDSVPCIGRMYDRLLEKQALPDRVSAQEVCEVAYRALRQERARRVSNRKIGA